MQELKEFIIILILLSFVSCSSQQTKVDLKTKNYKLDSLITNKELSAYGYITLREKPLYEITIETEQKIDWISFRSCSREVIAVDPRTGINRKKFSISYYPNEVERGEACPVKVQALNVDGMYSVGFIAFESKHFTLPAENICGSRTESSNGASTCSERSSSIAKIKFPVEVIASDSASSGCLFKNKIKEERTGREFTYVIPSGYCNLVFMEKNEPNRIHILYTYGYDDIQTRL